uniref:Uncharacterized protein n=1 Tax=Noctiluca scintillans TaxID=2966 RepID=A0A7S1EYK7_NOCSC|eukprot:CAMPEP_0194549336 /NCGR_PEP_ID=MMETSP0253-20130528/95062_1 /TAXON_ID=2966 /ORGANISM="Noctiluca scintillans" /LENGTH=294 /DNA_ID=CAMNT_0039396755 /DNA_START=13 /DNA_END=897 /DNA_ORIENTATION=+
MVQAFSMALSNAQISELAVGELPTGVQIPLRPHDVRELQRLQDCTSGGLSPRAFLADCFGLGSASSFQSDVLCDYFLDLLHHARTLCLSLRQMSVLTGIMWSVFAAMHRRSESSAPRVGESFTPAECYAEYRRLLLAHCGRHGTSEKPHMAIFSVPEAKQISAYVSSGLFNHFVLYKYCLVAHQAKTTFCNLTLDFPRPPPDLRSGKLLVEQISETPPISEVGLGADEAYESLTHAEVERESLQDDTQENELHADLDAFVAQSVYESEQRLLESIARRDEQLSEGRDKLVKGKG